MGQRMKNAELLPLVMQLVALPAITERDNTRRETRDCVQVSLGRGADLLPLLRALIAEERREKCYFDL